MLRIHETELYDYLRLNAGCMIIIITAEIIIALHFNVVYVLPFSFIYVSVNFSI